MNRPKQKRKEKKRKKKEKKKLQGQRTGRQDKRNTTTTTKKEREKPRGRAPQEGHAKSTDLECQDLIILCHRCTKGAFPIVCHVQETVSLLVVLIHLAHEVGGCRESAIDVEIEG